jgi:hypothetical protein
VLAQWWRPLYQHFFLRVSHDISVCKYNGPVFTQEILECDSYTASRAYRNIGVNTKACFQMMKYHFRKHAFFDGEQLTGSREDLKELKRRSCYGF